MKNGNDTLILGTLNILKDTTRKNKFEALARFEENVLMMVRWQKDEVMDKITNEQIYANDFKDILNS